jgi:tetratricopeptide (TPR) repeat protein
MKTLEKDRTRRYGSPTELAADIERHLTSQPVFASPPSAVYRMGKFVRRHRVGVAAGAIVLLALVLGMVGTTVGMVRATRAEVQATQEAETAKQVSDFLVGLFEVSDPQEARGDEITAREILEKGAEKIDTELQGQPLVQARLMGTMGEVYRSLALYPQARHLLEQALETRIELLGDDHLKVADSLMGLASVLWVLDGEDPRPLLDRALEIRERALGPGHAKVAETLVEMAASESDRQIRRSLLERALEIQEQELGPDHPALARALNDLGGVALGAGNYEEAYALLDRALAHTERVGGMDAPELPLFLRNLAFKESQDPLTMWSLCKRALAISERVFGPDHPQTADSLMCVANALDVRGDHEEALKYGERCVAIRETVYGPDHSQVALGLRVLGLWNRSLGRYDKALAILERTLRIYEKSHGPNDSAVAFVLPHLGDVALDMGDHERARSSYERHLEICEDSDKCATLHSVWGMARLFQLQGEVDKAAPLFEQALAFEKENSGEDSARFMYSRSVYHAIIGEHAEAIELLRKAIDLGIEVHWLPVDPNFHSLHGNPEFDAIVAEVKKRVGEE